MKQLQNYIGNLEKVFSSFHFYQLSFFNLLRMESREYIMDVWYEVKSEALGKKINSKHNFTDEIFGKNGAEVPDAQEVLTKINLLR